MTYKFIDLETHAGIATLTLNRPEQLNAISMANGARGDSRL